MRFDTAEPKFKPLAIVLESPEEIRVLMTALDERNMSRHRFERVRCSTKEKIAEDEMITRLQERLYKTFREATSAQP